MYHEKIQNPPTKSTTGNQDMTCQSPIEPSFKISKPESGITGTFLPQVIYKPDQPFSTYNESSWQPTQPFFCHKHTHQCRTTALLPPQIWTKFITYKLTTYTSNPGLSATNMLCMRNQELSWSFWVCNKSRVEITERQKKKAKMTHNVKNSHRSSWIYTVCEELRNNKFADEWKIAQQGPSLLIRKCNSQLL